MKLLMFFLILNSSVFAATKIIPVGKSSTFKTGLPSNYREYLKQELGDSCANIALLLNEQTNFQARAKSRIIQFSDITVKEYDYHTSATAALCEIDYVDQSVQ